MIGDEMKFEKIKINPRKNPAILDTATWQPAKALNLVSNLDESYWNSIIKAIREGHPLPVGERCILHTGSCVEYQMSLYFLAELVDGQQVFIVLGTDNREILFGEPIGTRSLENGPHLTIYSADAETIDHYVTLIKPDRGPKMLGAVPRLGIGSRMTTAAWQGVWQAMNKCDFRANPIQNSVREVHMLEDILAGRPPRFNYLANFGRVEEGHTGSTFEGLWVAGVLEALKARSSPPFGADADHITVRRSAHDISRAKEVIKAARRYTFFTLDVSDILNYDTLKVSSKTIAEDYLTSHICQSRLRKEVVAYHSQKCLPGQQYRLDKATVGRLVGKYWIALNAVEELSNYIKTVKNGSPFDLELSIDETPSGIDAFTCLTTKDELMFLILELQRREIAVTHIAPNFGVEKASDYRGQDGLAALGKRVHDLCEISGEFGLMLDCHSGDDLKPATRRAIGRAAQGNIHFKISPFSQVIFAETMKDVEPARFDFWWDDTLDYARRESAAGSSFAAECLGRYEASENREPSPDHAVFHYYSFGSVGKRNQEGQFVNREKFYDLTEDFYREYQERICNYLCDVAADVLNRT
jgi:hypothetical protein